MSRRSPMLPVFNPSALVKAERYGKRRNRKVLPLPVPIEGCLMITDPTNRGPRRHNCQSYLECVNLAARKLQASQNAQCPVRCERFAVATDDIRAIATLRPNCGQAMPEACDFHA